MSVEIAGLESFFVGGEGVELEGLAPRSLTLVPGSPPVQVDPNGRFQVGQMYVQAIRLARPRARFPLLMWHGGGMTGATWETRPDGAPGWQDAFLRAGHDTYVSDAVERGRSGWARYPEIFPGEPFFRSAREAWTLFRIGGADGAAFAGQRFPIGAFEAFTKQLVPRWSGTEGRALGAYVALLERVGPAVIVAHSQGGSFALQAALARPALVRALVLLEPGGAPGPDAPGLAALAGLPILAVWGDFIEAVPFWAEARRLVRESLDAVAAAGGRVEWVDLPASGVRGNSHLLMMDGNALEIAGLVQGWLRGCGLMREG